MLFPMRLSPVLLANICMNLVSDGLKKEYLHLLAVYFYSIGLSKVVTALQEETRSKGMWNALFLVDVVPP